MKPFLFIGLLLIIHFLVKGQTIKEEHPVIVKPATPSPKSKFGSIIIRKRIKNVSLLPHQSLQFSAGEWTDSSYIMPTVVIDNAVSKKAIEGKADSIHDDSYLWVTKLMEKLKMLHHGYLMLNINYFDRYRYNASMSRRFVYSVRNGKIELLQKLTENGEFKIDTDVNRRLDSFFLQPNQYIRHGAGIIAITNICEKCNFKKPDIKKPEQEIDFDGIRLLYEVLRPGRPPYNGLQVECINPWGIGDPTMYELALRTFDDPEKEEYLRKIYKQYLLEQNNK